jgi:hypothetical protein
VPVEYTGMAIILFGMVICLPLGMVLCQGSEQLAAGISAVFTGLAITRWIRQYRVEKRTTKSEPAGGG